MTDTKGMITVFGYGPTGEATVERLLARGQAVRVAQRKRPANLPAGVSFINCDALNADDGKLLWSVNVPKLLKGKPNEYGVSCSPLVTDGVVVVRREQADEVAKLGQARVEKEAEVRAKMKAGELSAHFYGLRAKLIEMGVEYVENE